MLPSFNKQALCAISSSYQPVTLYGEDKSRQLKFKLRCALAWLSSLPCVSTFLSCTQLDCFSSVSEAKKKEKRKKLAGSKSMLVKHRRILVLGKAQCFTAKVWFMLNLWLLYWQFFKSLCFSPKCICFLLRHILITYRKTKPEDNRFFSVFSDIISNLP